MVLKDGFMIKSCTLLCFSLIATLFCGCGKDNQKDDDVVSQRYVHKYGYAVSKEEWESGKYPGQVITTLRNGVTITSTYENNVLHGPSTHTYPHSQAIEAYYIYNQGVVVKEILYDIKGMPLSEMVQLSPSRHSHTLWYADGSPLSIEEFSGEELLEGQYFNVSNEIESRVEKGNGSRTRRDRDGVLLSKDEFEAGYMTKRETFYPNGSPDTVSFLILGKLHGEQKRFAENGEPLSTIEWVNGQLHGKSTYYKNGAKYLEVSFLNDQKNGFEVHFKPDGSISQEVLWENNKKHGPSVFYIEGENQTTHWYYEGKQVSRDEYDELNHMDEVISSVSEKVRIYK
jgi:antitoxin component YwqK of YwqJK toxin-antitoxin module